METYKLLEETKPTATDNIHYDEYFALPKWNKENSKID